MSHPITVCWTVPRSVSTSFERMVMERGDHIVFDEPYSRSYYFGPDRRSHRYAERDTEHDASAITAELVQAAERAPVFVKDMAYHAIDLVPHDVLTGFRHCFVIRHPVATLRSLAATWPDFTDEEAGWTSLDRMADLVERSDRPLVVVDSERLCAHPPTVVAAWCDAMDLEFDPTALTWEAGMRPEWELWREWHTSSAAATGFRPLRVERELADHDDGRVIRAVVAALPVYERLAARALPMDAQVTTSGTS
ncbi:MAG: hypothetical protein EA389_05755 [Ilumatobacter sp.]|nr:MAG: hypothetical protein EA389_05755 [Ilumatobacter sp.]